MGFLSALEENGAKMELNFRVFWPFWNRLYFSGPISSLNPPNPVAYESPPLLKVVQRPVTGAIISSKIYLKFLLYEYNTLPV